MRPAPTLAGTRSERGDAPDRPDGYDEPYEPDGADRPRSSGARQLARGLLFALFLAAGVALGLFIGVRYLPGLLDRL